MKSLGCLFGWDLNFWADYSSWVGDKEFHVNYVYPLNYDQSLSQLLAKHL